MRLSLREEMKIIDQKSASDYGLSVEQLMERAGDLMADEILQLPGLGNNHRIAVFCGPGQNGGDGLVVARKLLEKRFLQTELWCLPNHSHSLLFELNLRRLKDHPVQIQILDEAAMKTFDFNKFDLFIDGFFGTGLNRLLEPGLIRFIEKINRQKISVVALDIPTGLDANRGISWGACLKAVKTLTCGLAKPGFYLHQGPSCVGSVKILNMGFPPELVEKIADSVFLIGKNSAKK